MLWLPLLTALMAAAFALIVLERWRRKRRMPLLMWGIGLSMFAAAVFAGYLHRLTGDTELEYRLFYLFGAITNVAWLALGTIYLLAPPRVARASLLFVSGLSLVAVYAVFASPVDLRAAADTGRGFAESPLPRILAGIGSGGGAIVLFGGAAWSAYRFLRHRANPRRALANVLIAIAVVIFSVGGVAAFTGTEGVLELTNLLGLSLLFLGFLLA